MNFVQPEFPLLLLFVFSLYWVLPGKIRLPNGFVLTRRHMQNLLLVVTSIVFYGWVHPWFVGLLAFSACVDYTVALSMARWRQHKGRLLTVSMCANLGALGLFKYYDFFVENVVMAFNSVGIHANFTTLELMLPVGISFYTFQTMSYTIDVYRGELKARTNFLDYALYVSFFPQLVAGPIERAGRLLPQTEQPRKWDTNQVLSGFGLALWGGFKKICLADMVAPYVDKIFMLEDVSGPLAMAGIIAFGGQILADFSGYTDIARGVARMLGFELTINFNKPYLATSAPEFWRRWHISLSTWIGDYVYVPLLRMSKPGGLTIARSIMITFFFIGLWHGAAWRFVAMGLFYGVWMVFYTLVTPMIPLRYRTLPGAHTFAVVFHFFVVLAPAGHLFREATIARAVHAATQNPFVGTTDQFLMAFLVLSVGFVVLSLMGLGTAVEDHILPRIRHSAWYFPAQTVTWSVMALLIFVCHRNTDYDFIYFQF